MKEHKPIAVDGGQPDSKKAPDSELVAGVMAIDPSTMVLAFHALSNYVDQPLGSITTTEEGDYIRESLLRYDQDDIRVNGVEVLIGDDAVRAQLNNLAESRGFSAPFTKELQDNQLGIVSVVEKSMKWQDGQAEADMLDIPLDADGGVKRVEAVTFSLDKQDSWGVPIVDIDGFTKPVVRIEAEQDDYLASSDYMWVTELSPDEDLTPANVTALIQKAMDTVFGLYGQPASCLLYTSPSPRDA